MSHDGPLAELLSEFILDGRERLGHVEEILLDLDQDSTADQVDLLLELRRELHTIKGNAGMVGREDIRDLAHCMEDRVDDIHERGAEPLPLFHDVDRLRLLFDHLESDHADEAGTPVPADEVQLATVDHHADSVRVSFAALDGLVDVLAEMVIFRNRLRDAVDKGRATSGADHAWDEVESAEEQLGTTLNGIRDQVMALRMVPLRSLFVSFKRIVHDVALSEGKQIELVPSGGDTPMDKALLEVASEALGHIIRNAATHGIERPEVRKAAGKEPRGRIRLTAEVRSNQVIVAVEDDGGGIDFDFLAFKAVERGVDTSGLTEPSELLFHPGFSTRSETALSAGRGIGLSAAQEAVHHIGGRISVASTPGIGTRFELHLPVSVSITRALMLAVDGTRYALPISHVEESLHFHEDAIAEVNHALVYRLRDDVVPLIDLGFVLGSSPAPRREGRVVVIQSAGRRRALLVDRLIGMQEIVVKGLDPMVGNPEGVAGSTILGDGTVVLILDAIGLVGLNPSLVEGVSA